MQATKIEWADATWNPVRGCSRISAGCRNCYAERQASRFARYPGQPYHGFAAGGSWTGRVELIPQKLEEPLRWNKPRRIFVNSMSDLFHESLEGPAIEAIFGVMMACPQHTFMVLTKRPQRMHDWITVRADWRRHRGDLHPMIACTLEAQAQGARIDDLPLSTEWPLPNLWLGVSVENQETADDRIPILNRTPAGLRFISYEPALGPLRLGGWLYSYACDHPGPISWVIAGGETGPKARPAHPNWFRSIRDECIVAKAPFFFKQWGEWAPWSQERYDDWMVGPIGGYRAKLHKLKARMWCDGPATVLDWGRVIAGRSLEGREWSEFPCPPST